MRSLQKRLDQAGSKFSYHRTGLPRDRVDYHRARSAQGERTAQVNSAPSGWDTAIENSGYAKRISTPHFSGCSTVRLPSGLMLPYAAVIGPLDMPGFCSRMAQLLLAGGIEAVLASAVIHGLGKSFQTQSEPLSMGLWRRV